MSASRPPHSRSLVPSGTGWVLLVLYVVVLVLAALGAGQARLLVSTIAAFMLLGGFGAWLNLRGVRLRVPDAARATAGTSFPLRLEITRPGFGLAARDLELTLPQALRRRTASVVLPELRRGGAREVTLVHCLRARGWHRELQVQISSTFPLGLVQHRLHFRLPVEILVTPALGQLRSVEELVVWRRSQASRERERSCRPGEEEFQGLQEWRQGLPRRRIHWRASARHGRPLVRLLVGEASPRVHLVLATGVGEFGGEEGEHRPFERAVSLAATLASSILQQGYPLRVSLAGPGTWQALPGPRRGGMPALLEALAQVEPEPGQGLPGDLPVAEEQVLLVSAGPVGGELPAPRWRRLDVTDPKIRNIFSPTFRRRRGFVA